MSTETEYAAELIARRGRDELHRRLRSAFVAEFESSGLSLTPDELEQLVAAAAERADGVLWRRSLAAAAVNGLELELAEAVWHPAVLLAQELVGAPPYEPGEGSGQAPAPALAEEAAPDRAPIALEEVGAAAPAEDDPEPDALRLGAVHVGGIETLRAGERDIELRFSAAGLDVLKRSSGVTIGRLEWSEIRTVDLPRARRGLRPGRRRVQELHVATALGRATFELPDLTEEQLRQHLQPMLARTHGRTA